MDAFYASVEIRERPELAGRPVVVGGSPEGRGVVAAASYAARRYGIHSAMPAATARRLCPQVVFLPVRMEHYARVSDQLRAIFERFTPLVEPLSLDEAFLDVRASQRLFGPSEQIARRIKDDIESELHLTASVGVAPNKFLAKIASDLDKPNGLVIVAEDGVQAFLDPLSVGRLWGVGEATEKTMWRLGIRTVGDLRSRSRDALHAAFGKAGEHFWALARGIDERPVVPERDAKSISRETTFDRDIVEAQLLRAHLRALTGDVAHRLRRNGLFARTVFVKLRFADFETTVRSLTLSAATDSTRTIWQGASRLFAQHYPGAGAALRLIGVGVSGLTAAERAQLGLFDAHEEAARDRQRRLDALTDRVRERFGPGAVGRPAPGAEDPDQEQS